MYNLLLNQNRGARGPRPNSGSLLNWRNSLTRSLGFYVNCLDIPTTPGAAGFQLYEHVHKINQFPGSPTLVTVARNFDIGPALDFTGAIASRVEWNVGTQPTVLSGLLPVYATDNPFTAAIKFRCVSVAAATKVIAGFDSSSSTTRWSVSINRTTVGALTLNILDASFTITTGTGYNNGEWYTVFAQHIPGNTQSLTVFRSTGIVETVSGSTSDYTGGATGDFVLGGLPGGSDTNNFPGQIEWAAVWPRRLLSLTEMQALATDPYQIVEAPTMRRRWVFTSAPATCALSGTIIGATEADIVAGGKTIILTLTNDTWVAAGATFDAQRQPIINGLTSAQSETLGWNNVVKLLQGVAGVVRTSNTVVTITLDAQVTYDITSDETITVTVPGTALVLGNAIVASPTFGVTAAGAVGHPAIRRFGQIRAGGIWGRPIGRVA